MLADEGERIGEQIERHRETAAGVSLHRLVLLERLAVLVEDRHAALLSWLRWTELDAALETSRIAAQQIEDDIGDVLGGNLPVDPLFLIATRETGRHRSGHDIRN